MLAFLQGFAYGLWLSCLPWFIAGMINPRLALPTDPPRRWQVFLRYWLAAPFIALLAWLTSLWGGFGPSLAGWGAGLVAIPVAIFVERRWRRWRARRQAQRAVRAAEAADRQTREAAERRRREQGLRALDPERPPAGADDIITALCAVKRALLQHGREDLSVQVDRLYSRYSHVLGVLERTFDPQEMAFQRARGLVTEVSRAALDRLNRVVALVAGVANIDAAYVRRRLAESGLAAAERRALERRLALVERTEQRIGEALSANEAVLTVLDDAAVAVSQVDTGQAAPAGAADAALQELHRFAERATRYNRSP
ncbi:cobyrinic acid a,c-diamide synthase [Alkalilimnicola ehrlichii MLHE-1]|uniref:Cobyrinic acid a,c-diamide synthase n=1 Tax=Alkalilimnicola ehrlichii (strain ATCC BAA-1101 / DSM 17681 / MLHE-1) TaxID=187272 RepID=Q0A8G9_ALKEH|nr:hypothetical protein [Alkalilimnicola ehrlichii]ABI56868.1 hypothetical protein Mlg_1519 [Alkalilimnicola ehrlichii MLHE-1]